MSKKKYYSYTTPNTLYINGGNITAEIHPDHVSVLDLDFKVGDLVETHERELGVIVEVTENKNHVLYHLGCRVYKVQTAESIRKYGSLSIKKVKKSLDK